jgi:hypothetical protein
MASIRMAGGLSTFKKCVLKGHMGIAKNDLDGRFLSNLNQILSSFKRSELKNI